MAGSWTNSSKKIITITWSFYSFLKSHLQAATCTLYMYYEDGPVCDTRELRGAKPSVSPWLSPRFLYLRIIYLSGLIAMVQKMILNHFKPHMYNYPLYSAVWAFNPVILCHHCQGWYLLWSLGVLKGLCRFIISSHSFYFPPIDLTGIRHDQKWFNRNVHMYTACIYYRKKSLWNVMRLSDCTGPNSVLLNGRNPICHKI